jgi:hypothetical protein
MSFFFIKAKKSKIRNAIKKRFKKGREITVSLPQDIAAQARVKQEPSWQRRPWQTVA